MWGHAERTGSFRLPRESGGGVGAQSANAMVSNCVLTGNSVIWCGGACEGLLTDRTLIGNSSGNNRGGAMGATLNNCSVTGSVPTHAISDDLPQYLFVSVNVGARSPLGPLELLGRLTALTV